MVVRMLQSNAELHDYMVRLSKDLNAAGQKQMADKIAFAARFILGSPTEFLHEAKSALIEAEDMCSGVLVPAEVEQLAGVLGQIETAFKKIGGA